jgi:hypothetical protein
LFTVGLIESHFPIFGKYERRDLTVEQWKPVKGYEGLYEASDSGDVRRIRGGRGASAGRLLRPVSNRHYLKVHLSRNNKVEQLYVHCLVAAAFVGERPAGMHVNHKDTNKLNNSVANLEYVTPLGNTRHAIDLGLCNHAGEHNGNAKLNRAKVALIRSLAANSMPRSDIARIFGIKRNTVSQIVNKKRWRDRASLPDVREL